MEGSRYGYLRIALRLAGAAFLLLYPLMHLWPSGWAWTPAQSEYDRQGGLISINATDPKKTAISRL